MNSTIHFLVDSFHEPCVYIKSNMGDLPNNSVQKNRVFKKRGPLFVLIHRSRVRSLDTQQDLQKTGERKGRKKEDEIVLSWLFF